MVELRIVVDGQRVGGSLDHLVGVGIVEREVAAMLTLDQSGGNREVVETAVHLALMEGGGNRNRAVDLDAGRPETIVQVHLREGHFLNRSRRRLFGSTGGQRQRGHAYQ